MTKMNHSKNTKYEQKSKLIFKHEKKKKKKKKMLAAFHPYLTYSPLSCLFQFSHQYFNHALLFSHFSSFGDWNFVFMWKYCDTMQKHTITLHKF